MHNEQLLADISKLSRQSYISWGDEFVPGLRHQHQLVSLGSVTLTVTKKKHLNSNAIRSLVDRHFSKLARRWNCHIYSLVGMDGVLSNRTRAHIHLIPHISVLETNRKLDDFELNVMRNQIELLWSYGRAEAEPQRVSRLAGYVAQKNAECSSIFVVHCPKTGACSKRSKGQRMRCRVRAELVTTK